MTTLPNLGVSLPVRGAPGSGVWGDTEDANLALIDAHDHTSGKGVRIKTAAISLDADLTFSGSWAPTNLNRIQFSAVTPLTSNNKSLFVSSGDNELYWRSNAGSNVKLTSGSALNVAAFTGGIGGDYVSASGAVAFDDANKNYTFKSSGSAWARATFGGIRLIEFGTTETVRVGLLCPAGLAASYDITMPLAAPGSTSLVQMDSSGVLTASNTVANTLTTAAVTSSGLITANAGLTGGSNQHVTVAGTGRFKHGTLTRLVGATEFQMVNGTSGKYSAFTDGGLSTTAGASMDAMATISLNVGERLLAVRVFISDSATGPTKLQFILASRPVSTGAPTTIASSAVSAGTGAAQTLQVTGLTTVLAASTLYTVEVVATTGTAIVFIQAMEIDYDRP